MHSFIHVKYLIVRIDLIDIHLDDEEFCRVCLAKKNPDQSDYINASIIRSIPPVEEE